MPISLSIAAVLPDPQKMMIVSSSPPTASRMMRRASSRKRVVCSPVPLTSVCVLAYGARLLAPFSMAAERRICRELLADLGARIHPDTLIADLPPAARATVSIARATRLLREHGERFVFILDEPTAYLSADESQQVIALMRRVADRGSAVVFISHRLQEVAAVADRVTVLRDGVVVDTFVGQTDSQHDLGVAAGEIVGVAGLVGMGHEEIPALLAGAVPARAGRVLLDGADLTDAGIAERIALGVSMVPGNRQRDGVWLDVEAFENLAILPDMGRSLLGVRHREREIGGATDAMTRFGVRPPDPLARVGQFSGGNQQKVVLAKWLGREPRVLLLDEPTQGIDAGAKHDVLQLVCAAATKGAAVVIASGDYEQLANICHRVLILRFGRITGTLTGPDLTEATIAARAQAD